MSWLIKPVVPPAVCPEVRLLAWERLLLREEGTEAGGRLQKTPGYLGPQLGEALAPSCRPMEGTQVINTSCVPTHVDMRSVSINMGVNMSSQAHECALQAYVRREKPWGRDSWASDSTHTHEALVTAKGPVRAHEAIV